MWDELRERQSSRFWALPSPPRTTAQRACAWRCYAAISFKLTCASQDRGTVGTGIASLEGFRRRGRSGSGDNGDNGDNGDSSRGGRAGAVVALMCTREMLMGAAA
jgi:hypothetical protein